MKFDDWTTLDFPPNNGVGFVYTLFWVAADGNETEFYVGETKSIWRRLHEYYDPDVQAPTDFKVGEAIKHLSSKGFRIVVKYKPSTDRVRMQDETIAALKSEGTRLLNDCPGYKWDIPQEKHEGERLKIQAFIDALLLTDRISN
jgi:hypothetical protein